MGSDYCTRCTVDWAYCFRLAWYYGYGSSIAAYVSADFRHGCYQDSLKDDTGRIPFTRLCQDHRGGHCEGTLPETIYADALFSNGGNDCEETYRVVGEGDEPLATCSGAPDTWRVDLAAGGWTNRIWPTHYACHCDDVAGEFDLDLGDTDPYWYIYYAFQDTYPYTTTCQPAWNTWWNPTGAYRRALDTCYWGYLSPQYYDPPDCPWQEYIAMEMQLFKTIRY